MPAICRQDGRSSGSVISIEEHLARKDKYRAVAHGFALVHPIYQTSPEWALRALTDELEFEVVGLLSSFEIKAHNILLRLWHSYSGTVATANVLHITTPNTNHTVWQAAAKSINLLILRRGASDLDLEHPFQVEISNPDLAYHDISRCLPSDSTLLDVFNGKKDAIAQILSTELPGALSAISFHDRIPYSKRFTDCAGKPTVMVYCRHDIPANFYCAEERLIRLFKNVTVHVHVELIPDAVRDPGATVLGTPLYLPRLPRRPVHGSSISTDGGTEALSLGGWVYLNLPDRPRLKCMLTCHRVVRAIDSEVPPAVHRDGVTLESDSGHVEVVYPAEIDKSHTMEVFKKERLAGRSEAVKEFENVWTSVLQKRSIGRVLCSSGQRLSGQHRVDWALVDGSETFAANTPPSYTNFDPPFRRPSPNVAWGPNEDFQARDIGPMTAGDWVAFSGRTSGVVSGEVNKIKSRIFWPSLNLTSDEWEVLPLGNLSFNLPGDSGSMVFNSRGQIVGLNIANIGEAGYVMAMETIQKDIKERTHGFLSLD